MRIGRMVRIWMVAVVGAPLLAMTVGFRAVVGLAAGCYALAGLLGATVLPRGEPPVQ